MNSTKEKLKTILICVLIVGMVYLTYSVWFYDSPFGEMHLEELFEMKLEQRESEVASESDTERFGIRPMSVFIRDEYGSRGAVYSSDCYDLYINLRPTLADIFKDTGSVKTSNADMWEKAIAGKGVLLDYRGNVPVDSVRTWLGAGDSAGTICARNFMISTENDEVEIYLKNSDTGEIYLIASPASSDEINNVLSGVSAKKAYLAFESEEEDFGAIMPETVIVEERSNPHVLRAYNSVKSYDTDTRFACLESFRLFDVSPSTYSEQDGTEVYVADMVTLKISPEGIVSYSDPRGFADEILGIEVESDSDSPTFAEKMECARKLTASVASMLPGVGGIYLIEATEEQGMTEFVFGRYMDGVPIDMQGSVYFARIAIKGKIVSAAKVNLRCYDDTMRISDVLSERLAAAAMNGAEESGELNLRYADTGAEELSPTWFIGGLKKSTEEAE